MTTIKSTICYRSAELSIEVDYPSDWKVEELKDSLTPLTILLSNGAALPPSVEFKIIQTNLTLENELDRAAKISQVSNDVTIVTKEITKRKDASLHGVLVTKERREGKQIVSQRVIIPTPGEKFIVATAQSELATWSQCKESFRTILSSIRQINPAECLDNEDVEIVFTTGAPNPGQLELADPALPQMLIANNGNLKDHACQFDRQWKGCTIKKDILDFVGDESIAKLLWAALGSKLMGWLVEVVPALGRKTPKQCLQTESGRAHLKKLLSRLNKEATNLLELASHFEEPPKPSGNHLEAIEQLIELPANSRNGLWVDEILQLSADAHFYVPESPLLQDGGPGFTYYSLYTSVPYGIQARQLSLTEIINEVTEQGVGVVINPNAKAGFPIPYGQLWGFRQDKAFLNDEQSNNKLIGAGGGSIELMGAPSENLFPPYVKRVVRAFMQQALKCKRPRVFLTLAPNRFPAHALYFDILMDTQKTPQEKEHLAHLLLWYMRPGIAIGYGQDTPQERKALADF